VRRWLLKFKLQALGLSLNHVSTVLGAQVELRARSSWYNLDGCVVMADRVKPKFSKAPVGEPLHVDLKALLDEIDQEIRDNSGNPKWLKDLDPFNWPHLVPSTYLPKKASES
jgi:hypothetical protein